MGKHFEPQPQEQARRRISMQRVGIVALAALFLLSVFVGAYSMITHRSIVSVLMRPIAPPPQEVFGKSNLLVLLEGLDYDYNEKDEEYSTQSRSDVIKVFNLDLVNTRAFEVDVPRDMDATLPNGRESKINEAQSEGGVREAQAVISQFLGAPPFDRYVIFRANTAKDFINAIGGVDVDVQNSDPKDRTSHLDYDDTWGHLHIHLKPGMQHLNGDQAVGYMRFRHDWCGDPCRITRQGQVIRAAMAKLTGDKANTLAHLPTLIGTFNRDVTTNLTTPELTSLAVAFANMPKNEFKSEQLRYVDTKILADGGEVIIPDEKQKARVVRNFIVAPPAPTPVPNLSAVTAAPATIRVEVQNGTGIPGVAKRIAAELKAKGFVIASVGNARASDVQITEVHEHSAVSGAGLRVRDALGSTMQRVTVVTDGSPLPSPKEAASDVTVVVGQDLAATLHSASTNP